MEHVFCMDRDFKVQLCLWAPPCPIILTQSWYTNSGLARTAESPHLLRDVALTITPLEWLVATHVIFDRITGGKTSKIKWIFESNLILSILKALQGLSTTRLTLEDNSVIQNVWSQMYFQTPKIGHWKNGSWVQILDMALTPPVHECINNYALSTNKKTILKHCIIKHLNNIKTFY